MHINADELINKLREQIDSLNYNLTVSNILIDKKDAEIERLNELLKEGEEDDTRNTRERI